MTDNERKQLESIATRLHAIEAEAKELQTALRALAVFGEKKASLSAEDKARMVRLGIDPRYAGCENELDARAVRDRDADLLAAADKAGALDTKH